MILLYGVNHQSAPLDLRERLAVPEGELGPAVARLISGGGLDEGLILSTCNRTEILARGSGAASAETLKLFLQGRGGVQAAELDRHAYLHVERDAVRHLFRVASSLDSMIVGEPQILGQLKDAYAAAQAAGGLKTVLESLLQRAFAVAKKVRNETGIARAPVSIAHAAVVRAREIFGDLTGRAVLIVGAGKMARIAAQHITAGGVGSCTVVNRSYQRGSELALELGGEALSWDRMPEVLERADIVIVSTGAPHHVVTREDAQRVSRARRGRPVFFLDIAVPRNVDPRVHDLENVYLYDIDDLKDVADAGLRERHAEARLAEAMVDREAGAYLEWLRALEVDPTIVALRDHLHALGTAELDRFRGRLGDLTPEQRRVVEEFGASLMNKVLHHPILALKRSALRPGAGQLVAFLREAFGLEGSRPEDERRPAPDSPAPERSARDRS
ncbi:MAG TPA: glutamyl-tRNA reductase [Patescibacteria group bacterium]|nr:glutamyl-tRNA reductase [Patescibacteria group bacterium]